MAQPEEENYIIFDLETAGIERQSEILQIGAIDLKDNTKKFGAYVTPNGNIHPRASRVNGLTRGPGSL
jgi:DNA polymerase III epsilon subunit-like protein